MRVSVEIDRHLLNELLDLTGRCKMSPAIGIAVREFVRRQKLREFARLLREGAFDYPLTNEQVEREDH